MAIYLRLGHSISVELTTAVVHSIVDCALRIDEELVSLRHRKWPLRTHQSVHYDPDLIKLDQSICCLSTLCSRSLTVSARLLTVLLNCLVRRLQTLHLFLELKD